MQNLTESSVIILAITLGVIFYIETERSKIKSKDRSEKKSLENSLARLNRKYENAIDNYNLLKNSFYNLKQRYDTAIIMLSDRPNQNQFTQEEIRTMIKLCHPDKHGGNTSANAITAKLLRLRK
jgi:hypothetical protein